MVAESRAHKDKAFKDVKATLLAHGRGPRNLAPDAWHRFRHLSANVPADMTVNGMMSHLHLRTGDLWRQAIHQRLAEAIAAASTPAPTPTSPHTSALPSHHQEQTEETHGHQEEDEDEENKRSVGVKLTQLLHPSLNGTTITSLLDLYWRRYNLFVDEVQFLVRHLFVMVRCGFLCGCP